MALTYNTATGFTQATGHNLTKKLWDTKLHEQVQNKSFFKNMVGTDKTGEGGVDKEVANYPIVQKTQLGKESGDRITLGLVRQLRTVDPTISGLQLVVNAGKTGNVQLVDSEQSLVFFNSKVLIAHFREGVLIQGKMTEQRSPYDLINVATQRLSSFLARVYDDGCFFSLYAGYSPNVFRQEGHAVAVPKNNPNIVYGKDKSALTAVDATDGLDTDILERIAVAVKENNINPVMMDGRETYGFIVHPRGKKGLRSDSLYLDQNRQLAKDNPIFDNADGEWAGIYVVPSNKITTAFNYAGLTVASDAITLPVDTVGAGIAATDIRLNIVLGANAIARAYGLENYTEKRKEDDYNNLRGIAGGSIYGERRADWANEADTSTVNQSSLIVYTYSPNVNTNLSSIWT